ncbi:ubiquitin-protein ligase E3 C [Pseudohyphozyma bogoriensis]|nr:ubiquitin-protein ligase E3 C [Pseudohyphozyma bogoriensis]
MLFSGQHRSRPTINLGGSSANSSQGQSNVAERAKQLREQREKDRLRERASARIKRFVVGRHRAAKDRDEFRKEFDGLLVDPAAVGPDELVHATRLLVRFLGSDGPAEDRKRAGKWCRTVLNPPKTSPPTKTPLLFALLLPTSPHRSSWNSLLSLVASIFLQISVLHASQPQIPLFLEITKLICDPASSVKYRLAKPEGTTPLGHLVQNGLYEQLRALLLSIPPTEKTHAALSASIHLSLLPLRSSPPPEPALSAFLLSILTIPLLTHRLPLPSLTLLSSLPFDALILHAASPTVMARIIALEPQDKVELLTNLVSVGKGRIEGFAKGDLVKSWLVVLRRLVEGVPSEVWGEKEVVEASVKGKERELEKVRPGIESDDEEEDDGVEKMDVDPSPSTLPTTVDPRTASTLATLTVSSSILTLLTLSTRFSATTRPALCGYLVTLLHTLPAKKESILNTLMFSGPGGSSERGGGLLREIWRGWVRGGSVGKVLRGGARGSEILSALNKKEMEGEWEALILLTELYGRCLLTLGDDEFYSEGPGGSAGGGRNPLSLDEVVGFSGMLRELGFTLFWEEGAGVEGKKVVGTNVGLEELRALVTGVLVMIYARDSRRPFTPEGHWLMTSMFDLTSFIQTVVLEDERLEMDPDNEDFVAPQEEEDEFGGIFRRRRLATANRTRAAHLSKRQLAFISPRLGILNNIPFVIPFETRVAIFRQFVDNDRKRLGIERDRYDRRRRHRATIRRNHLSGDSFDQLNGLGPALKSSVEIVFIDEHGLEESGIDGGGLFKELLTSLSKEAFDTDRGLWLATKEQELYPNPHSYARDQAQLNWYGFIGRILGKALYEGILVDVRFAGFFLSKWLGKQSYLDDLRSLDEELYNGLVFLKNYNGNVEADLSLNFTVTEDDFGVSRTIELIPGGADVPVTNENRILYIYLTSNYRLNGQIAKQCDAFFSGLSEIIPERFLRLFNQAELKILVGGVDQPISIADLKRHTVYGGFPNDEANPTILDFWDIVEGFDKEERGLLVKFVTSCARPPLLGFEQLVPRFAIRNAGNDQERLPTSSTCVNLLKLSEYTDKENMRRKLLYAIKSGAGFDLS